MQKSEETPELVTIEGLKFERYQMDWIEISAKLDGQTPTEFIHNLFLSVLVSHLENLSGQDIMEAAKRIRLEIG